MYDFSVWMGLMDFVPVLLFAGFAVLLLKTVHGNMHWLDFSVLAFGLFGILTAGSLKACWKLLYAAQVCDFTSIKEVFLPLQSIGFLAAGLSLLCSAGIRKENRLYAAAPVVFRGTPVFLGMMVLGMGILCTVLSVWSFRRKKKGAGTLFLLAFLISMAMGYIGTMDSTSAFVNWLEQSVNTASQLCLLLAMCGLSKSVNAEN